MDEEWETEEETTVDGDDVGGTNVKSKEELEAEGIVLYDSAGKKMDTTDAKIPYIGVVYAPLKDTPASTMIDDETTCISDFAVIKLGTRFVRALPVAREEDSGNIDFYELGVETEEKKILHDCKNAGVKPAWGRWTSKKTVTGPDTTIFGDEKGCILLSTNLLNRKKPPPKKRIMKRPMKAVGEPPEKRHRPMTLTLTFSSAEELKQTLEKIDA